MIVDSTEKTNEITKVPQKNERTPGTTILPLARVKRVIKEDKDIALINAEATFCITYATELFIKYFVNEAFAKSKKDKRKTIYYKDLANTVSDVEQFEFLEDVIPQPIPLKRALELQKEQSGEGIGSHTAKRTKTSNTKPKTSATVTKSSTTNATTNSIKNAFLASTSSKSKDLSKNEEEDGNSDVKAVVSDDEDDLSEAEDLADDGVEETTVDTSSDIAMGDA